MANNVLELHRSNIQSATERAKKNVAHKSTNTANQNKGANSVVSTITSGLGSAINNAVGGNTKTNSGTAPTAFSSGNNADTTMSNTNTTPTSGTGNYADQLTSLYNGQQAALNNYQSLQNQAAQNAYNKNMSALQNAYNRKKANLESSLGTTKQKLEDAYMRSRKGINTDADRALQEAYINKRMAERVLPQQLTAQGLSGGASESAIAGLINNYGNARNNIDVTRNENLSGLEQTYNQNLANVLNSYYNALSSAEDNNIGYQMQIENALANNQVSSYDNLFSSMANLDNKYLSAMQDALANQEAYSAAAPSVSTTVENVSTGGTLVNVADFIKQRLANNVSQDDIILELSDMGYNANQIAQMFSQSGL